jgi:hypothetical protein
MYKQAAEEAGAEGEGEADAPAADADAQGDIIDADFEERK